MKRHILFLQLTRIPLDCFFLFLAFSLARSLREVTDFLPNIYLPPQTISSPDFLSLIILVGISWFLVGFFQGTYVVRAHTTFLREMGILFRQIFIWFFVLLGAIYLTQDRLLSADVPRLILLVSPLFLIFFSIFSRGGLIFFQYLGERLKWFPKVKLGLYLDEYTFPQEVLKNILQNFDISWYVSHVTHSEFYSEQISFEESLLQLNLGKVDEILVLTNALESKQIQSLFEISRVRGITYREGVSIAQKQSHATRVDFLFSSFPTIEVVAIGFTPYGRFLKRLFDIIFSIIGIILSLPLIAISALFIYLEDPSGPVIYKNTRVGKGGKKFTLYKLRYLYWNMSIKEAYGVESKNDTALSYENSLLQSNLSIRSGIIQKIGDNDPRRMKIARIIESFSIDELPQLVNVLLGDMTLVGPRPHQPREVEKYSFSQEQVLTVRPGITGIAQVSGRENLNFEQEALLDIAYIEHWSLWLDIIILIKTIFVVIERGYKKF